jgi:hypothetical protein
VSADRRLRGSRALWLGAALAVLVVGVLGARIVLARTAQLTGTNSVGVGALVADASRGEQTCIRDLLVPSGTRSVQIYVAAVGSGEVALRGELLDARGRPRSTIDYDGAAGGFITLPLAGTVPESFDEASLCLRSRRGAVQYGGATVSRQPGQPVTTVGRRALDAQGVDLTVNFLGARASRFAARLGDALERATRFKPFGPVVPALALAALVLAIGFSVRTMATAEGRSVRGLAIRAAGLALVGSLSFAVLLPLFGGPDESEHAAYAVHVAAAGERADAARTDRPPYSSSQLQLMAALHHNSTILNASSRPRWEAEFPRELDAVDDGLRDDDGGGYTESASGHSPLYPWVVSLPYRLFDGVSGGAIVAMRAWNALLASLMAALAVVCAALLTRRAQLQWLAGVLVATQPVFASVSGSINNDTGVNLLAAVCLTLTVHAIVRGPRPATMAALGVAALALPVMKLTGFALIPVIGVGLAFAAWRHRSPLVLAAPAAGVAALAAWVLVVSPVLVGQRGALYNVHPAEPAIAGATEVAGPGPTQLDRASYFVQTVTGVGLTFDGWKADWPLYQVYVERGYNLFGWPTAGMTQNLVRGIGVVLLIGWILAVLAAWRHRSTWRTWLPPAGTLLLAIVAVIALVAHAYTTLAPRDVPGEQGRYLFPAIVALGVLMACGVSALHGRARDAVLGAAAAGAPGLLLLAWLSELRGLYT